MNIISIQRVIVSVKITNDIKVLSLKIILLKFHNTLEELENESKQSKVDIVQRISEQIKCKHTSIHIDKVTLH